MRAVGGNIYVYISAAKAIPCFAWKDDGISIKLQSGSPCTLTYYIYS